MKQINSSYKLVEFLSGRRSGADTVVNVATIEFRFRAIGSNNISFDISFKQKLILR